MAYSRVVISDMQIVCLQRVWKLINTMIVHRWIETIRWSAVSRTLRACVSMSAHMTVVADCKVMFRLGRHSRNVHLGALPT